MAGLTVGRRPVIVVVSVQRRADQLAIRKALCFFGAIGWE